MASSSSLFLFLSAVLLMVGYASGGEMNSGEIYWNKLLPNTPLSSSLRAYLPTGVNRGFRIRYVSKCDLGGHYQRYQRGATMDEVRDMTEANFLFLEKDLKAGMRTKALDFVKARDDKAPFLPLQASRDVPFSTSKLDDILKRFSIDPNSTEAEVMKFTLENCEREADKGETRFCVTSMESMADLIVSQLRTNNVRLLTYSFTNRDAAQAAKSNQSYTVQRGLVRLSGAEEARRRPLVCHVHAYPYAVFNCHKSVDTEAYLVPLVGEEDGARVNAAALCHVDTSGWNPKHATMLALGAKPGDSICHFLSEGNYAFLPAATN